MNKKFLVLAFVSATFFFGCVSDGLVPGSSSPEPPAWDGVPSETNPLTVPGGPYCYASGLCIRINDHFTAKDCLETNAVIVISCP
ncbi:MAG: hypothetical protein FWF63_01020 [Fibromonadales bacterium]|nr:hypothetical protein [Fibromonadales bacterium]